MPEVRDRKVAFMIDKSLNNEFRAHCQLLDKKAVLEVEFMMKRWIEKHKKRTASILMEG